MLRPGHRPLPLLALISAGLCMCDVQRIQLLPNVSLGSNTSEQDSPSEPSMGGAPPEISIEGQGGEVEPMGPGGNNGVTIIDELPDGFVGDALLGGWRVVDPPEDDDESEAGCANILRAIVRDFRSAHPDFEQLSNGLDEGIVGDLLGADQKPILRDPDDPDDLVTSVETFDQWYRNVDGTNLAYVMEMWLQPQGRTFVFDSSMFFPLAGMGYALEDGETGQAEGFHFTTELHTTFVYQGGEEFTFRGDDDVWVFINGKLAIDLGGIHAAREQSVLLDEVATNHALEQGEVYALDLFQAERHTTHSNFRIETTLDFTDCGKILPTDIPVR